MDYSKMSTKQLEELCSQLQHEEYLIMKELIQRSQEIDPSIGLEAADMKQTEEDF